MDNICANFEKCPIYNGILKDKVMTSANYKKQFCEAGETGWTACKRYQVKEKTGKCPSDLLPNSFLDIEAIIARMNEN